MAKVKIQGHASGTGILTVTAPNTSTDRTITLPDATGTLATTADTTDLDGAITINESGADVDFRVESDGEANMLVVDGGNNAVGIGSATPDSGRKLHIEGGGTGIGITFKDTAGSQWGFINDANLFKLRRDSSSADHIIVDANGAVTMPLQPAFQARMSAKLTGLAVGSWIQLPFNTEVFDLNSDFNTSTYYFTAPVTGKYQLQIQLRLNDLHDDSDYHFTSLETSNGAYYHIIDPASHDAQLTYMSQNIVVLADMDANDTAKCEVYSANGDTSRDIDDGTSTVFSGFLVA